MRLDPEIEALLSSMAERGIPGLREAPVEVFRAAVAGGLALLPPPSDILHVEALTAEFFGGSAPARLYRPAAAPDALIVYYHGGGWALGSLDEYDRPLRHLANLSGAAIVSVDYRLAPEHRFPAAVDDALGALEWAAEAVGELASPGARLFIAGDSAGGNLAAVAVQHARDRGLATAGQILIYPATEGDVDADYFSAFVPPILTREDIAYFYDLYAPAGVDRSDPRLAPGRGRLAGLPPTLIVTAEHDLLTAEGRVYGGRLAAEGVEVEIIDYPGAIHGFFSLGGGTALGRKAAVDIAEFVRRQAARSAPA